MSQVQLRQFFKADRSFLLAYQKVRWHNRKPLIVHVIQFVILLVFLPIDIVLLDPASRIIGAVIMGLLVSLLSFIITMVRYYFTFVKYGKMGFITLARDLNHLTRQNITNVQNQEDLTSPIVLHAATAINVTDVPQHTASLYASATTHQINQELQRKFNQFTCWNNIYHFCGLGSIIGVIILMATAQRIHGAEIAILVVYLVMQAYIQFIPLIIITLIALSPIILIVLLFWCCCCRQGQDNRTMMLDLKKKAAALDDVVNCKGQCAICLQQVKTGDQIYQLRCSNKHIFHGFCLDQWMKVKTNCPTCRSQLPFIQARQPGLAQEPALNES